MCHWLQRSAGGVRAVGSSSAGEGVCSGLSHHASAPAESHQRVIGLNNPNAHSPSTKHELLLALFKLLSYS